MLKKIHPDYPAWNPGMLANQHGGKVSRLRAASSTASKLSLTATDQLGQWLKHPSTNVSHIASPNQSHLSHVDFTVLP